MGKSVDVLVIGGGPAGCVAASTVRKYHPKKEVLVVRNVEKGVIPCAIPYMFSSLDEPDENRSGMDSLRNSGIEVVTDQALRIDRKAKEVTTKNNGAYRYQKLILAMGSKPLKPSIPGIDRSGVFGILKDMDYLKKVIEKTRAAENVLVIGGGFIGVEMADEISSLNGPNVYLVEMLPRLLAHSFDGEFSALADRKLRAKGVRIMTDTVVDALTGNGCVEKCRFADVSEIPVDTVILGLGAVPNSALAADAGLDLSRGKGIWVDEYMRTVDPDVFAVGDCAAKRDFYTHKDVPVLLASTAAAEARIAGANLYSLRAVRENKGTVAVYSTYVDGLVLGSAGHTEDSATAEGFETVTGTSDGVDRHPAGMPGAHKTKVKLVFSKYSGVVLGGQVAGGPACGEMINLIGVAIQKRMSIQELETLQVATHPYLTSAPTMYPIVLAAQQAAGRMPAGAGGSGETDCGN